MNVELETLRVSASLSLLMLGFDAELGSHSPPGAEDAALAFVDALDDTPEVRTWRGLLRSVRDDAVIPVDTLLAWIRPRVEPLDLERLRLKRRPRSTTSTTGRPPRQPFAAKVALATSNRKLAPQQTHRFEHDRTGWQPVAPFVMTTTAPIEQSCPRSCAFYAKAKGAKIRPCYADSGFTRFGVARLERLAARMTPEQVAVEEALALDSVYPNGIPQDGARGGRDLRVHVAGDCRTPEAARIVGDAVVRWKRRGGGDAWTYTHAWRDVPRVAWGPAIAVHASCETMAEVAEAHALGYGAVLVVDHHLDANARKVDGFRILPCVAETHDGVSCASCRICLDHDRLHRQRIVVAFEAHGLGAKEVRRRVRLKVIG